MVAENSIHDSHASADAHQVPPGGSSTPVRSHIAVILDRTGSMESIREDTIGGFNSFLGQQRSAGSGTTLTLVQFDSRDPFEVVHQFVCVGHVPELTRATYVPRGLTPLYDAIGRGIIDLDARLAAMPADVRPGRIVFVIVTDGQENASKEFSGAQVRGMIESHRKAGWQFVFLSADEDAIRDGRSVNVDEDFSLCDVKSSAGSRRIWAAVSNRAKMYCASEVRDMSLVEEKASLAIQREAEREAGRGG